VRFRRNKRLVGVDIGSTAIKAIQLERGWKGFSVRALGLGPVTPDSIVDGHIRDAGRVADAVRASLDGRPFSASSVATSLSGNSVIVKRISVVRRAPSALTRAIESEIPRCLPFDPRDVSTDYVVTDRGCNGNEDAVDVLVVAAKKEHIEAYTAAISGCGRSIAIVDVAAFALQNAYEINYGVERKRVVALVDVGATAIKLNVISGNQSIFTRDIAPGGNAFTEAVQKELRVPFDIAEDVKTGKHDDRILLTQAQMALEAMADRAVQEMARTFDYLTATGIERIERILLTGGGSRLDQLFRAVRQRFGTEVARFNPFRRVAFDTRRSAVDPESAAALVGVALGLALRSGDER
jgi:type IV pilus assembly protein PilM